MPPPDCYCPLCKGRAPHPLIATMKPVLNPPMQPEFNDPLMSGQIGHFAGIPVRENPDGSYYLNVEDIRRMNVEQYAKVREDLFKAMAKGQVKNDTVTLENPNLTCMWCAKAYLTKDDLEEHEAECFG